MGPLSQARQEHQKEVENELMDSLLQIFDETEWYINSRVETPL